MVDYRGILQEVGYSNITENARELRMQPIYRDSDSNSVLVVYKDGGKWIDFARGLSGSFEELIRLSLKLSSIEETKRWLKRQNITSTNSFVPKYKLVTQKFFDKDILLRLQKDYHYCESRGISRSILEKFGGGIAIRGKLAGRYVFPIYDVENRIVGFAGRDIYNNSDRTKWKLISNSSNWVYPAFLNLKLIEEKRVVVLVESIFDCLSLFESGINNVLVLFGIRISNAIINFLLRLDIRKIIISTNNDLVSNENGVGNQAAKDIEERLLHFFDKSNITTILPKKANDWNDVLVNFGQDKIKGAFADAYC